MEISPNLKSSLSRAQATEPVSLILDWSPSIARLNLGGLTSRTAKRAARLEALLATKQPVFDLLRQHNVLVINDLEGVGQTVVEATADAWRKLFEDQVFNVAAGRVLQNERVYQIQAETAAESDEQK
jgi:hypothetical protein